MRQAMPAAMQAMPAANAGMAVSQPVQKRVIEAMPEDIKQLAKQWDSIVHSIEEPHKRTPFIKFTCNACRGWAESGTDDVFPDSL